MSERPSRLVSRSKRPGWKTWEHSEPCSGTLAMNSHWGNAIYTQGIHDMPAFAPVLRWHVFILVFIMILGWTVVGFAADWVQPEQQLARGIVAVTGPGAVTFDLQNMSSLSKKDVDEVTHGIRQQLEAAGVRLVGADQSAATVNVKLSENLQSYVWVSEIHQGTNEPVVVIVSVARSETPGSLHESAPLSIHKTPLWAQEDRILDVAVFEEMSGQSHLAVLSSEQVALFRFQEGRWQLDQAMPIAHSRPWPRDERGRIILRADHLFDVYLPGVFCQTSKTAPIVLTCHESDDPWPLSADPGLNAFFAPTRNFFTGVLTPGVGKQNSTAKFYSAAPISRSNYTLWLFSAVDGSQRLLDGITEQTARWDWGSDLASINSPCGLGEQILASGRDGGSNDSIRAYEFADRDPTAVSAPVEFSGTITALWTEAKGKSAVAVTHNGQTGSYEAFRLTISCSQ